jgi:hypothetical protein
MIFKCRAGKRVERDEKKKQRHIKKIEGRKGKNSSHAAKPILHKGLCNSLKFLCINSLIAGFVCLSLGHS